MIGKVLVQWIASDALRTQRTLQFGAKGSAEVVQVAVELAHPLFPSFYVLALRGKRWHEGFPVLQVGFTSQTRYATGWRLVEPSTVLRRFDTAPSLDQLLALASEAESPGPDEIESVRTAIARYLRDLAVKNQVAYEDYKASVERAEGAGVLTVPIAQAKGDEEVLVGGPEHIDGDEWVARHAWATRLLPLVVLVLAVVCVLAAYFIGR